MERWIKFDKPPSCYWSPEAKMSYLQRRIIVWSIMYYDWDESCVPDRVYDMVSRQLVGLRNKYPEEYKRTTYYYAMVDFDGSTGFDIPSRLTDSDDKYLRQISTTVYKQWKAKGGKTKR